MDGSIEPVEAAGTTLVVLPVPEVEPLEPALVLVEEPAVLDDPLWVLLVDEARCVPVETGGGSGLSAAARSPVPVTLVGAVPVDVADDVPVVEPEALGSVGEAGEVPSVLGRRARASMSRAGRRGARIDEAGRGARPVQRAQLVGIEGLGQRSPSGGL